jgi:hypothetical protein
VGELRMKSTYYYNARNLKNGGEHGQKTTGGI